MQRADRARDRRAFLLVLGFVVAAAAVLAPIATAGIAFVGRVGSNDLALLDTSDNTVRLGTIALGRQPDAIAITPDGSRAYVASRVSRDVSVVETATGLKVAEPIAVGPEVFGLAITPDGKHVYVASRTDNDVVVIDTATNRVEGEPIRGVGPAPSGIAITPDGSRAYVTNSGGESVSVINTATNRVEGEPIRVGRAPTMLAITPDGTRAYVVNTGDSSVSVINTSDSSVKAGTIPVGQEPFPIAITPDGRKAYVVSIKGQGVSAIDTATDQIVATIPFGPGLAGIAISPDGTRAYVTAGTDKGVQAIDTATDQKLGGLVDVGNSPTSIAITPDQSPLPSLGVSSERVRPGVPASFDASASRDPDGTIAGYSWDFGDRQSAKLSGPSATHVYAAPGTYRVSLKATDNEGCSGLTFTGQTALCNPGPLSTATATVTVAYPGVRVRCPRKAKSTCRFALQVVAKKPKKGRRARAKSSLATARVPRGRSAIVSLKPKRGVAAQISIAKVVLVKQTLSTRGSRSTTYRRLKIIR